MVMGTLGCAQTNGREGADAAVDTREAARDVHLNVDGDAHEVPRDAAMEVMRDSLCVGLDPASVACAREVLARIARHACEDELACHPGAYDPRYCDVYPGNGRASQTRNQVARVRLGTLRVDLDAAVCMLGESNCGPVSAPCEPLFVPTRPTSRCMVTEECGRDGYCVGANNAACEVHACAPRLAPGASCINAPTEQPCAWGERCIEGQCRRLGAVRVAQEGESCRDSPNGETFDAWECAEGSGCAVTSGPPMFEATCVHAGMLGEPCTVSCGPGLLCQSFVCVPIPMPNVGDRCVEDSLSGFCAGRAWGLPCIDGICELSRARLGEACHQTFRRCVEGYCGYSDELTSTPICIAERVAQGAFCIDPDDCEDGLCCGGVCVPVPE